MKLSHTLILLCAVFTLAIGCGAEDDAADFDTLARERLPIPVRGTPIVLKRESLPDEIRSLYFLQELEHGESTDSLGAPFKFYSGARGLGAIYVPQGSPAVAIYGAILEEWARCGYEGAPLMGYPIGDEVQGRQEFQTEQTAASVENNGLVEMHHYLVEADGGDAAQHVYVNYYLDTYSGRLSTEPQRCVAIDGWAPAGTVLGDVYGDTILHTLHCGTPPPGVDPNTQESPGASLDDI